MAFRLLRGGIIVTIGLVCQCFAKTCDSAQSVMCSTGPCRDPAWPHDQNSKVVLVGDDLFAPSMSGGCSAVSLQIAHETSLVVENSAMTGLSLGRDLALPSLALSTEWVVIAGGRHNLVADATGLSVDLDELMSPYDSGHMAQLVGSALRFGAKVVLVSYATGVADTTDGARAREAALMERYRVFARSRRQLGEHVYFVDMRGLSYASNATHFAADGTNLSWTGGLVVGAHISYVPRAATRHMLAGVAPPGHATFGCTCSPTRALAPRAPATCACFSPR